MKKNRRPQDDVIPKVPKPRGNPNFVKGGKGGPGRKPNLAEKIPEVADFMRRKGWAELEWLATYRGRRGDGSRAQVPALTILAAYGFGKPSESLDLTSNGNSVSVADFLSAPKDEPAKD